MRHVLKTTGILLAAAIMLTGCQSSKEKYTFRDTGIEQLNAGSYSEAIQSFDEALKNSDGLVGTFEVDVLKYRAEAEYKAEDYSAAAHTYEILNQVDESRPEYQNMQNMLYIKAGELDKAMAAYQEAYGPDAGAKDSKENSDKTNSKDGSDKTNGKDGSDKKDGKDKTSGKDSKTDAGNESGNANTGGGSASGNTAVSNQVTILLSLGQALTEAERFDDARMLYQQAIDDGIQSDELYNRMGLCELEDGNFDQALTYFDAGMQMPDEGARQKLFYNRAAVYEQKMDFATALELLETYAATYGTTPEVEKEITFLKSRQ